jgi:hypothetical protein
LSNILQPQLIILSDISQSISLQKSIQIADIESLFLSQQKKRENFLPIDCSFVIQKTDFYQAKKKRVQFTDPAQTFGLSVLRFEKV